MSAENQITDLFQSLHYPLLPPTEKYRLSEWQKANPLNSILGALVSISREEGLTPHERFDFDFEVGACIRRIIAQQEDARNRLRLTFSAYSSEGKQPAEADILGSIKKGLNKPFTMVPKQIRDCPIMALTGAASNLTFGNFRRPILTTLLTTLNIDLALLFNKLNWETMREESDERYERLSEPVPTNIEGAQFHSERKVAEYGISYQFFLALNDKAAMNFVKSPAVLM